jgi:nucleoside-triphosphatase
MGCDAKIMITGLPGCGKTTLIQKLAQRLADFRPVGFYTEEIRRGRVRTGFALRSFDGREGVLASVDFPGKQRVGKYGVDVAGFETFLEAIHFDRPDPGLIMIDEIGRMECLSRKFQGMMKEVLDSDRTLIATIALHGGGVIAEIKSRKDVRICTLTVQNRDRMVETILAGVHNPLVQTTNPPLSPMR